MLLCYLITCPSLRPVDPWFSNSLHELHDSGGHVREPGSVVGQTHSPTSELTHTSLGAGDSRA